MEAVIQSFYTTAGLLWKALWALAIGYAFSSVIQVFISKKAAAKHLGQGTPKQLAVAALLGFVSSSCSFAALSATRGLFTKGASLVSALAFMFASTNLAIEVAALAYIFLGWQYALGLFVGAPIIITIQAILIKLTLPEKLATQALAHAKEQEGMEMDPSEGLPESIKAKLMSKLTWHRVGSSYKAEWKMVYKEIAIGFLVAGFVATLVPSSFFQAIFPTDLVMWLVVPLQALLAPILAIFTVIGSMGNGPLAAILANNGVTFGAIMAFLYADFNVPPAVKINANYYGWPFALYIAVITGISAILTGIAVHLIFALLGILPTEVKSITELAAFQIDYTFWLNILAIAIAVTLFSLARHTKQNHHH
ncbi:transporter [Candidatus Peregrinibacteria bacterium CG_4_9_14_0_2_um_filter_53_11]|nr:MAG: transporter [Candidatus Peregrinibacteria bacterium CG_4_9_14_0_2_um_filter_53_11]